MVGPLVVRVGRPSGSRYRSPVRKITSRPPAGTLRLIFWPELAGKILSRAMRFRQKCDEACRRLVMRERLFLAITKVRY
jgi:hypothetical protein